MRIAQLVRTYDNVCVQIGGVEREKEAGDDEEEEVRGAMQGDLSDRPVLEVPHRLGDGQEAAGAVRTRVRLKHHRRDEPLWIIFAKEMIINLKEGMMINSDKTIDRRGAHVRITNGVQVTVQNSNNVIIHNIHIHDIVLGKLGMIRDSLEQFGFRTQCRWGYFHVVNNDYTHWLMYAIGGSKNPTIISQGNRYTAPPNLTAKQITKHLGAAEEEWKNWVYMALGGGPVHGGDLLHHVRRCDPEAVQQQGPDQAQAWILRREAHALRRLHPVHSRQEVLDRARRAASRRDDSYL
ncbi:hypothetical protein OsI_23498 [Oryza sativa Indica Group]|uniref:Pectate lyase domain-containing protein n=1 Tax=Oryza sativa subsp. indica TaxID=39946 RepID=B8B436_ORYSI|nr:hypothetical protein OsI_23498 [Oryza sativa Indica Group]